MVVRARWTVDIGLDSSVVEHLTSEGVPGSTPGPAIHYPLYVFVYVNSFHIYFIWWPGFPCSGIRYVLTGWNCVYCVCVFEDEDIAKEQRGCVVHVVRAKWKVDIDLYNIWLLEWCKDPGFDWRSSHKFSLVFLCTCSFLPSLLHYKHSIYLKFHILKLTYPYQNITLWQKCHNSYTVCTISDIWNNK